MKNKYGQELTVTKPGAQGTLAATACSAARVIKPMDVISTLTDAAKVPYDAGDDAGHRLYCQAIGCLMMYWKALEEQPNDPKLNHGHWKVTPKCNRGNQISYHRRKL